MNEHLFHDQPFKNYVRNDQLWMRAMPLKPTSDRSNMADRISDNNKLSIQKTLNTNENEANPQFCGMNVLQHNPIQSPENMERIGDRMLKILDQNMLNAENVGNID